MPQLERQISQNLDDGYVNCLEGSGYYFPSYPWLWLGHYDSLYNRTSAWLLFRDVAIPPNATIDAAKLTIVCRSSRIQDYVNTRIEAVAQDNPTPPTSRADYMARPRTTAYIYWDNLGHWPGDEVIHSPDFKDVIQEMTDKPYWHEGDNILLYWQDCEGRSTQETGRFRQPWAREGSTTKAAKLTIDFTPPGPCPEIQTLDATNIKSDQATLRTKVIDDAGKTFSVRHNYGKTTAYGSNTPWQEGKHTNDIIAQTVTNLDLETQYHFRGEAVYED